MTTNDQELQILLVEDNPADAEMTMDALRQGHLVNKVHWVKDGAEALDFLFGRGAASAAETRRLRLVLLDLRLPRVDGLEVLRVLRADERTRRLPVVVLTTSKEEQDVAASYDLGVNSYIRKPVDFAQFVQAIQHLGLYWLVLNEPPPPKVRV
jgi:two-component system response regulator